MRESSWSAAEVLDELDRRRQLDPSVHDGRLFGLVYPTGRADVEDLVRRVYDRYLFSNALNPLRFPELLRLEREVLRDVADLVHRPATAQHPGAVTSGGTESILMSMLVARGRARARGVERPQILASASAHPAYAKAAHYFDMEYVAVPLDDQYRADVTAAASLISERTAVVIANAYSYPHGAMDPVTDLAALALERGVACHVDACVGGMVLPFLEELGHDIPAWDFRVPGVTQMSVDLHKYGYVPKGVSVVLHRDDDWLWHQTFFYDQWGSGLYATPAMAGARSGAPVAAAWAVVNFLGRAGLREIVAGLADTTARLRAGIEAIEDLAVVGEPVGPLLALTSESHDLHAVADALDDRGWHLNRNVDPYGLHLMVSPVHGALVDELLAELADAVAHHGPGRGAPARYA